MNLSIYSSAFNLIENQFDYTGALENFSKFADLVNGEVVIAVNESKDETLKVLKSFNNNRIKIIDTNFSYDDPFLDGKIKNAALLQCQNKFRIGLDLDERIPLRHFERWQFFAKRLKDLSSEFDAFFVPTVDLWGDYYSIKQTNSPEIKFKWYLHNEKIRRGAVKWAIKPNGFVDRNKSDTCEAIYDNGELAKTLNLLAVPSFTNENYYQFLEESLIFIFHLGYADFAKRILRNKNFWAKHWAVESGEKEPINLPSKIEDFSKEKMSHGLRLWNEI